MYSLWYASCRWVFTWISLHAGKWLYQHMVIRRWGWNRLVLRIEDLRVSFGFEVLLVEIVWCSDELRWLNLLCLFRLLFCLVKLISILCSFEYFLSRFYLFLLLIVLLNYNFGEWASFLSRYTVAIEVIDFALGCLSLLIVLHALLASLVSSWLTNILLSQLIFINLLSSFLYELS